MDLRRVFDQQIVMEQMLASIYGAFARKFSASEEVSRLWRRMAEEEERHAGALYWCRSLMVELGATARMYASCSEETREAGIEAVREILNIAERGEFSILEAASLTVRMEALEVKKLSRTLESLPENDIFREVIERLVAHDQDHERNLSEIAKLLPATEGTTEGENLLISLDL